MEPTAAASWATKDIVVLVLALTAPLSVICVVGERLKSGRGFGIRALQLLGLGVVVPIIGTLALLGTLDGAVSGTLFGGVIGYLFASNEGRKPTSSNSGD